MGANNYRAKGFGGESRGKCLKCGLSTKLSVHQKCGDDRKYTIDHPRDYGERECKNLDCLKKYNAVASNQKFCPECSELNQKAQKAKRRRVFTND